MKIFFTAITTLLLFLSTSAWGQRFEVASGDLKFVAVGKPGFIKISGESKDLPPTGFFQIQDGQVSGEFELALKQLDTGIGLRNDHLKEKYLEVHKFPKALLKINSFQLPKSGLTVHVRSQFHGLLTLHGVQKNVTGFAEFFPDRKNLTAQFELKLSEFDIQIPQYMGVTVSEKVEVQMNLNMAQKGAL